MKHMNFDQNKFIKMFQIFPFYDEKEGAIFLPITVIQNHKKYGLTFRQVLFVCFNIINKIHLYERIPSRTTLWRWKKQFKEMNLIVE